MVGPLIRIHGLYPNPFVEKLKVYYVLKYDSEVKVSVFNVAGEVVYTQSLGWYPQGANIFEWKGVNNAGARLASGIYPLRMEAASANGEQDDFWEFAVVAR